MKKTNKMKCLILGGSYFIGKAFLDEAKEHNVYNLYVANRGTKQIDKNQNINVLTLDRNEPKSCEILLNYNFDLIVDFSCWSSQMLKHILSCVNNNPYYIFISSGYAELTDHSHPDYEYGQQKNECESLIQQRFTDTLIIRPGYVMGEHDYTNRFYKHPEIDLYFYNQTTDIAMPYINVAILVNSLFNLMKHRTTGLVKLGYL